MARPIVTDPNLFDGEPHIEGTAVTVDAVKAYWKEPGVGAIAARAQFPGLSDSELAAAITYSPPWSPRFEFTAEDLGPPVRSMHLWCEEVGWAFAVSQIDSDGTEQPLWDIWAETFDEIALYPAEYASREIIWRDRSGEIVDIQSLNLQEL